MAGKAKTKKDTTPKDEGAEAAAPDFAQIKKRPGRYG